ncbi:MAG: hypothetical protein PW788_03335 [Micavibrio sp.]|nr:hypothetical protein [Micavibrio sp.]
MTDDPYVLRVVYKNENVEIHEFKNKQKALHARDKYRKMDAVLTAKIISVEAED